MRYWKPVIALTLILTVGVSTTACNSVTEDVPLNSHSMALVERAKGEFQNGNGISDATLEQIKRNKKELLPAIKAGLNLEDFSVNSKQEISQMSAFSEWGFWLEIVRALDDRELLPVLTAWLTSPQPIPDPYRLASVLNALIPKGEEDRQFQGIVRFLTSQGQGSADKLMAYYDSLDLPLAARRQIIDSLIFSYNYQGQLAWLQDVAANTTDVYTEQVIDQKLVLDSGDYRAAERLYCSGTTKGFQLPMRTDVTKFLVKSYPDGKLAQGIKRYEAVRGRAYFFEDNQDGWYRSEGKDFDQPAQGIKGWLAFIEEFPLHPGVDDAAYRLARCYHMTEKYAEALSWFNRAAQTGDGDIAYDAAGQFLYTLDVAMTSKEYASLDKNRLPGWAKPLIKYSEAVEMLRDRRYQEAAKALQDFITSYNGQDIFTEMFTGEQLPDGPPATFGGTIAHYYPFWQKVKEQLALAEEMGERTAAINQARGQAKAKEQYDLAAVLYHQPFLFYNHLWRGERQDFFWYGQIKYMDYNPLMDRYISRFNNYVQAIEAFQAIDVDQADPVIGAKTLYSLAMAFSKLINYGEEVAFYDTDSHLGRQLINAAENLTNLYPDSPLADDAMLLIYHYTGAKLWLEEIIKQYPAGDQAEKAKMLLAALEKTDQQPSVFRWDPIQSTALTQTLNRDDWRVPKEVRTWLESTGTGEFYGLKTVEEWTYIFVQTGNKEALLFLNVLNDLSGTTITYLVQPVANIYGMAKHEQLLRLPSRFIQFDRPVQWVQSQ